MYHHTTPRQVEDVDGNPWRFPTPVWMLIDHHLRMDLVIINISD